MGASASRFLDSLPLHLADAPVLSPQYRIQTFNEVHGVFRVGMEVVQVPRGCPHCEGRVFKFWGSRLQVITDLPRRGRPVELVVKVKRFRCSAPVCRKTFMQALPAVADNRAMTQRLCRWVCEQALVRTYVSIAAEIGVDEKTVRAVFADHLQKMRLQVRTEASQCMAVVPVTALNGQRYVILNVSHGMVAELLEEREGEPLADCLKAMKNSEAVARISIGFDPVALNAVRAAFPSTMVFIDPLAVQTVLQRCVLEMRGALRSGMSPYMRRKMAGDAEMLVKGSWDLDRDQWSRLEAWFAQYPALGEAYAFKDAVLGLYRRGNDPVTQDLAIEEITEALSRLGPEVKPHFAEFAKLWIDWCSCIVGAFAGGDGRRYVWGLTTVEELSVLVEKSGRGNSVQAVRAKLLFPPSLPVFSMSTLGISLSRLRTAVTPQ